MNSSIMLYVKKNPFIVRRIREKQMTLVVETIAINDMFVFRE